jgi:hypothetical protein
MQIYDRFKSNPFRFWASVTNTNRPIAADSSNNHILNANDANGAISRISRLFPKVGHSISLAPLPLLASQSAAMSQM